MQTEFKILLLGFWPFAKVFFAKSVPKSGKRESFCQMFFRVFFFFDTRKLTP